MSNNSSHKDILEGLAKNFTADIINKITKFQPSPSHYLEN